MLEDAERALELELHPDARRLSVGFPPPHHVDWALAALDVLEAPGLAAVQDRAAELAAGLADRLGERARPRGRSTLVAWSVDDPEAEVERLRAEGFGVRQLPGTGTVRASVGAWSTEAALGAARRRHLLVSTTIPKTTEPTTAIIATAPRTAKAVASSDLPSRLKSTARVTPRIATP